jgi:hypothetical protein
MCPLVLPAPLVRNENKNVIIGSFFFPFLYTTPLNLASILDVTMEVEIKTAVTF